jgi:1,2-diacylglycerol 3-beta-galactosyltransferase
MSAPDAPEVLLVLTDAGGGHRAAANALIAAAEQRRVPFRLRVLKLQDALAGADFARVLLGQSMEDTYNRMIRRGWTRHLVPLLRALHLLIEALHGRLVRMLARELARSRPAAVVSLMPNFNGVIRDAVRAALPGVPFLVLLTDYADFPPHFWLEQGIDLAIVGSDHAVEQALHAGLPKERVARISGMPLHPRHHAVDRAAARDAMRRELAVSPYDFLVMLLFGGKGAPEIEPLSRALLAEAGWHVVASCGDHEPLLERVRRLAAESGGRLHAIGFSDRVAELLAASDLLLTKPGPGSLAEAFHHGVPVVVTCNDRTVPQERWNAVIVKERGLGMVVDHWREMPWAATLLLRNPDWLFGLRTRVRELPPNRAVYEALDVIEAALEAGRFKISRGFTAFGEPAKVSLGG